MIGRMVLAGLLVGVGTAAMAQEVLAPCSKCLGARVVTKSGIGTALASVEARVTRADAEAHCETWSPGENRRSCADREMAAPEAKRSWRATADCLAGRITAVDGKTYTLAGTWTQGPGRGRAQFRDSAGRTIGQDNASFGLGIAQQWETLCPRAVAASPAPARPAQQAAPLYSIGQAVEVRFVRDWVRGQVTAHQRVEVPGGFETHYAVRLDSGLRGVLPPAMVRPAPAN